MRVPPARRTPEWARAAGPHLVRLCRAGPSPHRQHRLVQEEERPAESSRSDGPAWKGKVVMARPQYGTSATQAACLFEVLGPDRARQYVSRFEGQRRASGSGQQAGGRVGGSRSNAAGTAGRGGASPTPTTLWKRSKPVGRWPWFFPIAIGRRANGWARCSFQTLGHPERRSQSGGGPATGRFSAQSGGGRTTGRVRQPSDSAESGGEGQTPAALETPSTVKTMDVNFAKAADLWAEVQTFFAQRIRWGLSRCCYHREWEGG